MLNPLRRADPAFYQKEPHLIRAGATVPRYGDDAQVAVRLDVLRADRLLRVATIVALLSALALISLPAVWSPVDDAKAGFVLLALVAAVTLRGRVRAGFVTAAIGVFFCLHAHPTAVAPLVGLVAACGSVAGAGVLAREWRARPQVLTWAAFAALLLICAYTMAFNAPAVAAHLPIDIGIVAVGYLAVCVVAGRIRHAELLARPEGVLSLPQSIVPLLDRSHDHAIICWLL